MISELFQYFKYASRSLLKSPGFSLVAVLTLSIGIGVITTIYSIFDAVILNPLNFPDSHRVVMVVNNNPKQNISGLPLGEIRYEAVEEQQTVFSSLARGSFVGFTMTGGGDPQQINGMRVSPDFFKTLGILPRVGRSFTEAEDQPGTRDPIVISHGFWQSQFGGDPNVIGKRIQLDGEESEVVGLLPEHFGFPFAQVQVFAPRAYDIPGFSGEVGRTRGASYMFTYGRLREGVSIEQASNAMRVISERDRANDPGRLDSQADMAAVSWKSQLTGNLRPTFFVLLGSVGFVLLIACANVSNLLLTRATNRRKELAIRSALGANLRHLVYQFITETMLLAFVAACLGICLAFVGVGLARQIGQSFLPPAIPLVVNFNALMFTVLVALLVGLVLGLFPSFQATRPNVQDALRDNSRGAIGGAQKNRVRSVLIISEVALSIVLLAGAGLFMVSFWNLQNDDPGFDPEHLLVANISLPESKYPTQESQNQFFLNLVDQLREQPQVVDAGAAFGVPLSGFFPITPYAVDRGDVPPLDERPFTGFRVAYPGYFQAMGIEVLEGRDFERADVDVDRNVVMINKSMAAANFPDGDAVGNYLVMGPGRMEIIGVVDDVKTFGVANQTPEELYYSTGRRGSGFRNVVIRGTGDPNELTPILNTLVAAMDSDQPINNVNPMTTLLSQSLANNRLVLMLIGAFAGIAFLMAMVGIYSVMAYSTAQRTSEIGIRIALGANSSQVVGLILVQGLKVILIGAVIGIGVAFGLSKVVGNLLFGLGASSFGIYGCVTLLFILVGLLACFLPALKASRIDPIIALRED